MEVGASILWILGARSNQLLNTLTYKAELAPVKAPDVTIKKLTRGNPTMAAKFAKLEERGHAEAG